MSAKRVLVAMSGGIDSSVTAMLLHEQGYEVIGVTMKTWDYAAARPGARKQIGCCNLDTINDARQVAVTFGFPHMVLDIRKTFGEKVIQNFTQEYLSGRTPNPCVLCNTYIKWEALLERADELDCPYIATGHYANVRKENGRYILSKGKDTHKDQSYALWGLTQKSLSRTILPLGTYTKPEIRKMAIARNFQSLATKPESYEICFIPDNNYRGFLKHRVPGLAEKVKGGEFVNEAGKVLGRHQGYPFYTIGQRKGLGIALGYPVYVTDIQPEKNRVVLGTLDALARNGMHVKQLNMIKYPALTDYVESNVKVRYSDRGSPAVLQQIGDTMKVFFGKGVRAITPGQAAVFYEGDDVIGGGWISASFRQEKATRP